MFRSKIVLMVLVTCLAGGAFQGPSLAGASGKHDCVVHYAPTPEVRTEYRDNVYKTVCELSGSVGYNSISFGWTPGSHASVRLNLHDGPTILATIFCDLFLGTSYCGVQSYGDFTFDGYFIYNPLGAMPANQVGMYMKNVDRVLGLTFTIAPRKEGPCASGSPPTAACIEAGAGVFQLIFY